MHIALIAAMDKTGVIGFNNSLPWHLPADLAHFKKLTWGKPLLMGRKTFESIGKPLPGRTNIILSREITSPPPGCLVANTLSVGLKYAEAESAAEAYIIGGASLYQQALAIVDDLFLTIIDASFSGDTFFPQWDPAEWILSWEEKHVPDEKNTHPYKFQKFTRKRNTATKKSL